MLALLAKAASILASIAAHPIFGKVIIPAIVEGVATGLERIGKWNATASAVKASRAAETEKEMLDAAEKLRLARARR